MATQSRKADLRRDGFTFRQFFVAHDRCAMKVGTDGVLLGAWAPLIASGRILDIGAGCGLIALMLAQRTPSDVMIDALELDGDAAAQAAENCGASPWRDRLRVIGADILDYAVAAATRYDLIVSNPPYFPSGVPCRDTGRDRARYTVTLGHEPLLAAARRVATPRGRLALVLPYHLAGRLAAAAPAGGWFLRRRCDVADSPGKPPHRSLLEFSCAAGTCAYSTLSLRGNDRAYTPEYRALTREFYLGS
ncbi:tRNA1(Val) (adenine(37)-N6)-methyltransferase [Martelella alba]|uniref:tRNA1(Val) (adenine(37)-N6)-methyltransferase n=1 Tax=Martelella alba TaxID=2590451 RepID=A0ABY2SN12_9HYPH|nr:methyltransferase [Martelella alba]TKI06784.1 methyltransferase [Martelella alba]